MCYVTEPASGATWSACALLRSVDNNNNLSLLVINSNLYLCMQREHHHQRLCWAFRWSVPVARPTPRWARRRSWGTHAAGRPGSCLPPAGSGEAGGDDEDVRIPAHSPLPAHSPQPCMPSGIQSVSRRTWPGVLCSRRLRPRCAGPSSECLIDDDDDHIWNPNGHGAKTIQGQSIDAQLATRILKILKIKDQKWHHSDTVQKLNLGVFFFFIITHKLKLLVALLLKRRKYNTVPLRFYRNR